MFEAVEVPRPPPRVELEALQAQVDALRDQLAALEASLAERVVTRELAVVDRAGCPRIVARLDGGLVELEIRGADPTDGVSLFVSDEEPQTVVGCALVGGGTDRGGLYLAGGCDRWSGRWHATFEVHGVEPAQPGVVLGADGLRTGSG